MNVEHNDHLHMLPCTLFPLSSGTVRPCVGCSTICEAFIRHGLLRRLTSLKKNPMMRGPAVLLLLVWAVALSNGQSSAMKEIMEGIDMYNFRARCWGEANVDRQIAALETAKKICMQVFSFSKDFHKSCFPGGLTA